MANPANDPQFIWRLLDKMEESPEVRRAVHEMFYRGDLSFLRHDGQLLIHKTIAKATIDEILIFCSRQFGKSFEVMLDAIEHLAKGPRRLERIFSHSLKQVNDIVEDNMRVIELLSPEGFIRPIRSRNRWLIGGQSELRIGPIARAHVDGNRGGNATRVAIEEGGFTPSDDYRDALGSVINPQLLRSGGQCIHVTTVSKDTRHYIHTDILPKCQASGALARLDIYKNPQLTPEQIKKAHDRCTTPEEWDREYMVKIVRDQISTVLPEFRKDIHVVEMTPPKFAYWMTAIDFGGTVDKHAVLLGYNDFERDVLCIYDERFLERNTATKVIREQTLEMEKQGQWLDEDGEPYRVSDCPGQILVDLRNEDFRVIAPDKPKGSWEAGINELRLAFDREKVEIHPRCKWTITCFEHGQYTENRKDFQRTEELGHLDPISAAIYMWRHRDIRNPFPRHLGKSRFTHHVPPEEQESMEALDEAFTTSD